MKRHSRKGINTKKIGSFLALLSFTAYMPVSCTAAFADIAADTLPNLKGAVNGHTSTNGSRMDVTVDGGKGTVGQFDWNSFDVGKNAHVNFEFSANNQTALNRVLGGRMSEIYGKLTESSANGCAACVNTSKVILINPAGIMFGNGSSVNLNSFTASTYDIKNVKNIEDLTTDALKNQYAGTGGETGDLFGLAGYNKSVEFVPNDNFVNGNGVIVANPDANSRLASIVAEGADIYANKTIAFVGNKIDIKGGSKLTTTYDSTPNASNKTQTRSNVKLVTGDGVNFYYTSAGNIDNTNSKYGTSQPKDGHRATKENYGISVDNSEIRTGNFLARNDVDAANSEVKVSNSKIYSKKLLGTNTGKYTAEQTGTNGSLSIYSNGTVDISNSDIQTTNDMKDDKVTTGNMGYGNMAIQGKRGVNIKNSQLRTANSSLNKQGNINAGNITIASQGNINMTKDAPTNSPYYNNTGIVSAGDLTIQAGGDVNVNGYDKLQAQGVAINGSTKDYLNRTANITGKNVNLNNTTVAANDININADKDLKTKNANLVAPNNLKLRAENTTLDASLLHYKDLSLYDENSDKLSNLTVRNNTTFYDIDSNSLTLKTNGNIVLDNEKLQRQAYGNSSKTNHDSINVESTKGHVTIQNKSDIQAENGSIKITAGKEQLNSIYINGDSKLTAKNGGVDIDATDFVQISDATITSNNGDTNIKAEKGKVTAKKSNVVAKNGNLNIEQAISMDINEDFNGSTLATSKKLTLNASSGIKGKDFVEGQGSIDGVNKSLIKQRSDNSNTTLIYDDANLTTKTTIDLTNMGDITNVAFDAGNSINVQGNSDMKLKNVSSKAGTSAKFAAAGKLTTDKFDILGGNRTTLEGSSVKTIGDSTINANGNKLAVNSTGEVDIGVTGVNNKNAGLEVNADVNTSQNQNALTGRKVTVRAKDGTLAISKIKADTLNLTADNILAAKTTINSSKDNVDGLDKANVDYDSKAYIEIKTDGGFNLDATTDYNAGNKDMYTGGNYGTTTSSSTAEVGDRYTKEEKDVKTDVTKNSEKVDSKTTQGKELSRHEESRTPSGEPKVTTSREENVTDENGNKGYRDTTTTTQEYDVTDKVTYETTTEDTYKDTETTKTTTTTTTNTYQDYETTKDTRDKQHVGTLNKEEKDAFVLVYGKNTQEKTKETKLVDTNVSKTVDTKTVDKGTRTETTKGQITKTEKRKDTVTTSKSVFCEYEDTLTPDIGEDVSSRVKIPRHAEGISNVAPVQNDLADTSSTVVAAAARLQLDEDSEQDDEDFEE